jgi:hypothetical protein
MKVVMDRNTCGHHPAACEQCFGEFLRRGGVPDRACVLQVVEDGRAEIQVEIKSGKYVGSLTVTDANREEIIYDGWMKFVKMPREAFDILPPQGDEIRRQQREQESRH